MKMRIQVLSAFVLATSFSAAPVAAEDVTTAFMGDAAEPHRAIGLLVAEMGVTRETLKCTATLISPSEVLTAAHCVIDTETGRVSTPGDLSFFAGYSQRQHITARKVTTVQLEPRFDVPLWVQGFAPGAPVPIFAVHTDLALLTLDHPIESVAPLPLSTDTAYSGPVALLGYAASAEDSLQPFSDCETIQLSTEAVGLTCAADVGVSGAALVAPTEKGWAIIGTVAMISTWSRWLQTIGPRVTVARIAALREGQ